MGIWSFGTSNRGLGLSEKELGRLSPRQYVALANRWKDAEYKLDWRMANQMSLLANIWKGKDVKPFTVDDFMPKPKEEAEQPQTWQQQLFIVQQLQAALQGAAKKKKA
jgi:hypothetical protein